jgi:SAM-dependent methyltransferase
MSHKNRRMYPKSYDKYSYVLNQLTETLYTHYEKINSIEGNEPGKKLLDYGCDTKPYIDIFKKYEYIGADLEFNKVADLLLTENGTIPVENGFADLVISTQVLEHVDDPIIYLKECNRVLKNNSFLILSTHGVWEYHPYPKDLWRWTSEGLKRIVIEQGFEVISFTGVLGPVATAIQLIELRFQSKLDKSKILKKAGYFFFESLIKFFDKLENSNRRDSDASCYVILARKKHS